MRSALCAPHSPTFRPCSSPDGSPTGPSPPSSTTWVTPPSLLWPLALVPFFLPGFNDLSIVWIVWILGFAAFAALMVEVYRLAEKLTGPAVALSASALCALFGGFIWFAASGMETLPLAWILVRTGRVAAQWTETEKSRYDAALSA